jgi:hypothetical protein
MRRLVAGVMLLVLSSQTACYDWVALRPQDAGSLSSPYAAPGPHGTVVPVVDLERADGRMVRLAGNYGVRVTLKTGEVYEFSSPVRVEKEDDGTLVFRGGNEAPLRTRQEDIATLEGSTLDAGKTIAAMTLPPILAGTLAVLVVLAVVGHQR